MDNIFFLLSKYIGAEFLLTKKLPVFQSGCTILCPQQQYTKVWITPRLSVFSVMSPVFLKSHEMVATVQWCLVAYYVFSC